MRWGPIVPYIVASGIWVPAYAGTTEFSFCRRLISPLLDRRLLLVRAQHQLLHAPVQDLGDVELVLGRAGDLVNPSELLGLLARAAQIAQYLAFQGQFVDAPGIGIGAVEHLVRPRRDAERPRRAGREAAAGLQIIGEIWLVADRRFGVLVERHVDLDLALEVAVAVEHLDAPVVAVADIDQALRVGGDAVHEAELAGTFAVLAPGFHPLAVLVVFGDAGIHIAVADIDVALRIPGDVGRLAEAAVHVRERRIGVALPRMSLAIGGFRL